MPSGLFFQKHFFTGKKVRQRKAVGKKLSGGLSRRISARLAAAVWPLLDVMPAAVSDHDDLRATIERALRYVIEDTFVAQAAIDAAVAAALRSEEGLMKTASQRVADESKRLLARFDEVGGGRLAAGKIAMLEGKDPQDSERIAQRIRRLVRERANPQARRRKTNPVRFEG